MQMQAVKLEVKARAAKLWLVLCLALSPIVGRERASRWACRGVARFARYRVGGGPWMKLPPEALA